jgi:beta-lactamase class D
MRMHRFTCLLLAVAGVVCSLPSRAETICTVVMDVATSAISTQEGRCEQRYTPASTFKIAMAAIGFDSGFLHNAHAPALPFKVGYPDWGGQVWKQTTDPTRWMAYSVVWYSQQLTHALGEVKLHDYAKRFAYGNADFSGDSGKNNGLDRSWISSSLKISPLEQVAFLQKLVNGTLPVSGHALTMTRSIVEETPLENGWVVKGKTGMAYPRKPDYSFDEDHPWGWFVGWVTKGERTYVFARLIQDDAKTERTAGVRAREALITDLPALLAKTSR